MGRVNDMDNINQKRRPNVVMIFPDTMVPDGVGAYGGDIPTPNIDKVAAAGMKFTCATPNSPLCSPARYNVLTGRYASRCLNMQELYTEHDPVFLRWNMYLTDRESALPRVMKQNGYVTGMVGKWHLGEDELAYFDTGETSAQSGAMDKVKSNYDISRAYIKKHSGFDYVENVFTNNETAMPMPEDIPCQHNMPWITQGAKAFIEKNQDKPFFLYVAPNVPHMPPVLPALEAGALLTPEGFLEQAPDVQPSCENLLKRLEALGFSGDYAYLSKQWLQKDRYAGMMWLDDSIGTVLDTLERCGIMDDTIIIINTDHLAKEKMTCNYQQVPLIFQWNNKIKAGSVCDALVSHVDLTATILDLCGEAGSGSMPMDGKSFKQLLFDPALVWDNTVYTEVTYARGVIQKDWAYIAVRFPDNIEAELANGKAVRFTQEGMNESSIRFGVDGRFPAYFDKDQLYDLKNDPLQRKNLADDPRYADKLAHMKKLLANELMTMPFSFGEFTDKNCGSDFIYRRGQRTQIYVCPVCGHIEFGASFEKCPVCSAPKEKFTRNDAIFYEAEERQAVDLDGNIPRLKFTGPQQDNGLSPCSIEYSIAEGLDATGPKNPVEFADFYADGVFVTRKKFSAGVPAAGVVDINTPFSSVSCVVKCAKHGYWQRELARC